MCEPLTRAKPFANVVTMNFWADSWDWKHISSRACMHSATELPSFLLFLSPLPLSPPLSLQHTQPPKLSEAEHLILSLPAKLNHVSDFYFSHWFQVKPNQILNFSHSCLLTGEDAKRQSGGSKCPHATSEEGQPGQYFPLYMSSTGTYWDVTCITVSPSTQADPWDGTDLI